MPDGMPGAAAAPALPTPPPRVPAGPTGPATVAPDMAGRRMEAHIEATMALNALERAAGKFGGSQSEEGREILAAVLKLRKRFGSAEPDLQRQQLKVMGQGIPPVQTPTPQQGQALGQAVKRHQMASGLPGAA